MPIAQIPREETQASRCHQRANRYQEDTGPSKPQRASKQEPDSKWNGYTQWNNEKKDHGTQRARQQPTRARMPKQTIIEIPSSCKQASPPILVDRKATPDHK